MRSMFLAFALFATPLFSAPAPSAVMEQRAPSQENGHTFQLPLESYRTLSVSIPPGFKSVQPLAQFDKPEENIIEYIPENATQTTWNELITVNKFVGQKIQAAQFILTLTQELFKDTQQAKIIMVDTTKETTLEHAINIIQYVNRGKQEVSGASYYSGPSDAAGVQFTVRLQEGQTVADAVKRIQDFFRNNTKVSRG